MKSLNQIQNEIENFRTDAHRVIARDLLAAEEKRLDNSLIPLDADHKEIMKQEKEARCLAIITCVAVGAGVCALTAYCISKGKKKIEAKAAEEKAKLEAEKKELYRRMASLKGRS